MRTRQLATAAGAAACALAVGCGSVPAGHSPAHSGRQTTAGRHGAPTAATAAANRRLAQAEAARLLALVPVPARAVRLGSAPSSLPYPAIGLPGAGSLLDWSRSWRLPMSYRAAVAWLRAHRPAGLAQTGSSGAFLVPASPTAGYGYGGPASPAWSSAELDIEVGRSSPGGSVMRADSLIVWLDPVPAPDTMSVRPLRVLASANCPSSDAGRLGVINPGAGLRRALVPPGRPRYGSGCGGISNGYITTALP
jgi:hypothetical protein